MVTNLCKKQLPIKNLTTKETEQNVQDWHKAAQEDVQTGHREIFVYHVSGQTLCLMAQACQYSSRGIWTIPSIT